MSFTKLLQVLLNYSALTSKGWEEILWHLGSFAKVITFYHMTCSDLGGFILQESDGKLCQSSVFYLIASLICGGYLLVNYQKSIFHIGNLTYACSTAILTLITLRTCI